jgi:two-component system, chemotaxis family, sensor kinase CheA
MIEAQKEAYREEAQELLAELEISLLALEETPNDVELIGRVFRALHTIKGSGAMFGFDDIAAFTHEVESVFDLVRNDRMAVTKPLVDLTLAAGDQIRCMLDSSNGDPAADPARAREIIKALAQMIPGRSEPAKVVRQSGPAPAVEAEKEMTYRISIALAPNIFLRGTNPILLLNELRELGACKVIAHTEAIPDLVHFNPEECRTSWDVILTTERGINAIKDVFIFVEDECDLGIHVVAEGETIELEPKYKRLGEILIDRGCISQEAIQAALGKQKRIGELLVDSGLVGSSTLESALVEQEHVKQFYSKQQREELTSSIKVPAARLDVLVNLVGELVTVQARLSQTVAPLDHLELLSISEEVERLTAELRDNTMSIRMLPIGTMFSKFKRLVRDLSNELGKDIVMVTEGAETELDKTVIERLNDPLVHLIRNGIDHGIEYPDLRESAGKPKQGTIHLSATHSGANVLIRIADDGAGLDAEAIRAKAIEGGVIGADAELSEKESFALIFAPGFSTARQVTSVSGRGVGLDVVKRSIDALRGAIEVTSRRGVGTTITLKLPLTLAIIDGLLVKVGEGYFVVPLAIVEECVELTQEERARAHGQHITYVRGEIVPYVRLRETFFIHGEVPSTEQIVITESPGGKVGFAVDKVIGEHQTVIKNLGRMYRNVEGISGATILGDGTVALIMDVPKLVQGVEVEDGKRGVRDR